MIFYGDQFTFLAINSIIIEVLRKTHTYSVLICRLIRESIMLKKIQEGQKLIQTLFFPSTVLSIAYEGMLRSTYRRAVFTL